MDVTAIGIFTGEGIFTETGLGSLGKQVEKHVDPHCKISPFLQQTTGLCCMSQGLPRIIAAVEFSSIRGVNESLCKQPTRNVMGLI